MCDMSFSDSVHEYRDVGKAVIQHLRKEVNDTIHQANMDFERRLWFSDRPNRVVWSSLMNPECFDVGGETWVLYLKP